MGGTTTTYVDGEDFLRNRFDTGSPEGTATGTLVLVDLPSPDNTSGCTPGDFGVLPADSVVLVQRGGCGFAVKAVNAQAAGAEAVIVMGNNNDETLINMIGAAPGLTIPAVFVPYSVGADLASTPGATVTVTVDYDAEIRTTSNVLAETSDGNDDNVVIADAHLDSVQDGPGINDNGSGSAGLLETAIQMQKTKPNNTVRFAWWGAEEEGLLGSEHYVGALSEDEVEDIALYLNFDMIGSPNYMFGIYDGDNSGGTARRASSRRAPRRSRTCSRRSTTAAGCRHRTASSRGVRTTARSSPSAFRRGVCSREPRCRRRPPRPRSTAA